MRLGRLLVVLSSITAITESVPFLPRDGKLQRLRRRGVDYPLLPYGAPTPPDVLGASNLRRRFISYSVVPVNGGTATNGAVAPTTVYNTVQVTVEPSATPSPTTETVIVTEPAPTVSLKKTKTVLRTKIITRTQKTPGKTAHEVSIVTTTEIQTGAAAEMTTTVIQPQTVTVDPVTIVKTKAAVTQTIVASPSPTTTIMYDNGQYHPPYPKTTLATTVYFNNSSTSALPKMPASSTMSSVAAYPTGKYGYGTGSYGYGSYAKRALNIVESVAGHRRSSEHENRIYYGSETRKRSTLESDAPTRLGDANITKNKLRRRRNPTK